MKIYLKTFGCRVNQTESQSMREKFAASGATFCAKFEESDLCLLNTCTVTENADADVEKSIRQILNRNPNARLVLTGCYASAHKEKIKQNFPKAEVIEKHNIGPALFNDEYFFWTVQGHDGRSRAFVKIQDGCDCFCSYCIVPFARPVKSSKPLDEAVKEIKNLIQTGFKEIVLTGINIGNYEPGLAALLSEIFKLEGDFRVRFSSIELNTLTSDILQAAASGGSKFCDHFHLPLQSGSDAVLKHMRRHYAAAEYKAKVDEIKKHFPDAGIFADVIAGYPTETEQDFAATVKLINECGLSGLHAFSFSSRPGTDAAKLPPLPPSVIKTRAESLRELDKTLRAAFAAAQKNRVLNVLTEEEEERGTICTAANFQRVLIKQNLPRAQRLDAYITAADADLCIGEIVDKL